MDWIGCPLGRIDYPQKLRRCPMECDESFRRKITQQEGLLFDRKAYVELWDDRRKASFVKDIIALANTSRFTGKKSELILGVKDDGIICGIDEMIEKCGKNLDNVRRQITQILENYIEPALSVVDIETVNCDGFIILSIGIPAIPSESPFKVRKNLADLKRGESWIRTGESNEKLTPDMERYYPSYLKCPYIFPEQWKSYFSLLQESYQEAMKKEGYQELLTPNGKEVIEEIQDFLGSNKKVLVLIGEAAIGKTFLLERFAYGRAELLEGDIRNQENFGNFYYPFGFIPIFVSLKDMRLKDLSDLEKLLVDCLRKGFHIQNNKPKELYRLFENQQYHFVVLLDGIDELFDWQARRQFIRVLEDMTRRYPEMKFILSTRPPSPSFAEEYKSEIVEIKIQPFTREQIRRYIEVYCDIKTLEKVQKLIYSDEELTKICSIPFYLETALPEIIGQNFPTGDASVDEGESIPVGNEEDVNKYQGGVESIKAVWSDELILEQPIEVRTEAPVAEESSEEEQNIRIGLLLDKIYCKAWKRETEKKNIHDDDTRGYWSQTEQLAISVNLGEEISDEQIRRFMRKKARLFCLSLSVLTETNDFRVVRFFTELTQVIFAANQLKEFIEKNPRRFKSKFDKISNQFREKIIPILQELSPAFYTLNSQEE
jgi:hypothetical protein